VIPIPLILRRVPHVLLAALLCAAAQPAHAEADHAAIAQAALTNVIRPGYAALTASTGVLKDKAEVLCEQPSAYLVIESFF